MKKSYKIKDLALHQRPREKLKEHGARDMSHAELLAVIFGSGSTKEGVLEMADRVMRTYGDRYLSRLTDVSRVSKIYGLSENKACQLIAVFELGRRFFGRHLREKCISSPEDVQSLCEDMRLLDREELRAFYVNSRNLLVLQETISIGSLNMNIASPREILRPAVEISAAGIILAHNHPSGETEPSKEDLDFTEQLQFATKLFDIDLMDHLIITKDGWLSFKQEGKL